ncbi:unnamed protein product [Protopolystoma xenopodis]|uniref:Uncharacterized protein n=1 Tax=Protopolystoma xenopodis TaxID=117903 RepID=A0A448X3L2_9PLAT|nr:unnamed protein product [Protopolystoma xenopodis]
MPPTPTLDPSFSRVPFFTSRFVHFRPYQFARQMTSEPALMLRLASLLLSSALLPLSLPHPLTTTKLWPNLSSLHNLQAAHYSRSDRATKPRLPQLHMNICT